MDFADSAHRSRPTVVRFLRRRFGPWLVVCAALAAGCSSHRTEAAPAVGEEVAATSDATPEWLFTIQAEDTASFDASTSTLSLPASRVQAFTDRPFRDTRTMTPQEFDGLWGDPDADSFTADPPNAVLTYWEGDGLAGVPRTVVCEIDRDAGYRLADGSFHFGLAPLDPIDAVIPQQLHGASLFIDSVDDLGSGAGCPPTAEQQAAMEQIASENERAVQIVINDLGNKFEVMLMCDPRIEQTGLVRVTLGTASGNQQTGCEDVPYDAEWTPNFFCNDAPKGMPTVLTCDGHAIVFDKAKMAQKRYTDCAPPDNRHCKFTLTFASPTTGAAYATSTSTEWVADGNQYIYPELDLQFSPNC